MINFVLEIFYGYWLWISFCVSIEYCAWLRTFKFIIFCHCIKRFNRDTRFVILTWSLHLLLDNILYFIYSFLWGIRITVIFSILIIDLTWSIHKLVSIRTMAFQPILFSHGVYSLLIIGFFIFLLLLRRTTNNNKKDTSWFWNQWKLHCRTDKIWLI